MYVNEDTFQHFVHVHLYVDPMPNVYSQEHTINQNKFMGKGKNINGQWNFTNEKPFSHCNKHFGYSKRVSSFLRCSFWLFIMDMGPSTFHLCFFLWGHGMRSFSGFILLLSVYPSKRTDHRIVFSGTTQYVQVFFSVIVCDWKLKLTQPSTLNSNWGAIT